MQENDINLEEKERLYKLMEQQDKQPNEQRNFGKLQNKKVKNRKLNKKQKASRKANRK